MRTKERKQTIKVKHPYSPEDLKVPGTPSIEEEDGLKKDDDLGVKDAREDLPLLLLVAKKLGKSGHKTFCPLKLELKKATILKLQLVACMDEASFNQRDCFYFNHNNRLSGIVLKELESYFKKGGLGVQIPNQYVMRFTWDRGGS